MYWALRNWLSTSPQLGIAGRVLRQHSPDELAAKARRLSRVLIWIETPANPTWDITDIAGGREIAHDVGAHRRGRFHRGHAAC